MTAHRNKVLPLCLSDRAKSLLAAQRIGRSLAAARAGYHERQGRSEASKLKLAAAKVQRLVRPPPSYNYHRCHLVRTFGATEPTHEQPAPCRHTAANE